MSETQDPTPQNGKQAKEIKITATLDPVTLLVNIDAQVPNMFVGLSIARLVVDEFEHRTRLAFVARDRSTIEVARGVVPGPHGRQ